MLRVEGIWVTLMVSTGEVKRDLIGRWQPLKQGRKTPFLFAQGVWLTSGSQKVVAWGKRPRGRRGEKRRHC